MVDASALASAAVERREASASRWTRGRIRRCGPWKVRLSALRLPSWGRIFGMAWQNSGASASRERNCFADSEQSFGRCPCATRCSQFAEREHSNEGQISAGNDLHTMAAHAVSDQTRNRRRRAQRSVRSLAFLPGPSLPPRAALPGLQVLLAAPESVAARGANAAADKGRTVGKAAQHRFRPRLGTAVELLMARTPSLSVRL